MSSATRTPTTDPRPGTRSLMTLISAVSRVGASADRIIPQVDRTGAAGNLHIPLWVMHTSPL